MIRAGAALLVLVAGGCAPDVAMRTAAETGAGHAALPATGAGRGSAVPARAWLESAGLLATLPRLDPAVQTGAQIAAALERFCGLTPGRVTARGTDLLFEPGSGAQEVRRLRCVSAAVLASPALAEHGYALSIVVTAPG